MIRNAALRLKGAACPSSRSNRQAVTMCCNTQWHTTGYRQFSGTFTLAKKRSAKGGAKDDAAIDSIEKIGARDVAFDFTAMERSILNKINHLTSKLADIKSGGSFNPAVLENLSVQPDKKSEETVQLRDLAQVVTRGRLINIILSDETHIKPVKSAIQGSNLSLTPQGPAEDAPTTLVINMPPPTGESRQAALDSVTKLYNATLDRIREARQDKHKELRAMQLAKTVNPDELQKASKEMEVIVKKFSDEVKTIVETHKRVIAR